MVFSIEDTSATAASGLQNNVSATGAPTVNNDTSEGYSIGSFWIDVNNDEAYRCVDASTGAAVWIKTTLEIGDLGTLATQNTVDNSDWSGAALAVANGGTGSSTEGDARTALGAAAASDLTTHTSDTGNPHSVTKAQVGLTNVTDDAQLTIANNLSDLNSSVLARSNLGLGTMALRNNISDTDWNSASDLVVANGGTGASDAATARTNLDVPSNSDLTAHTGSTSNPHSVTKAQVGLTNVTDDAQLAIANNLSDLNNTSTARTNLGLGTIATQANTSVNIDGGSIDGTTIGASSHTTGKFTFISGANGSPGIPTYSFISDSNSGFYWVASDHVGITAGGEKIAGFIDSGVSGYDSNGVMGHRPLVDVTASETLALEDANTYRRCDSASAITITVPPNSSVAFDIGVEVEIFRGGTGTVTIAEGSGVTVNSIDSNLDIASQYGGACLKKVATNEWDLVGNLG